MVSSFFAILGTSLNMGLGCLITSITVRFAINSSVYEEAIVINTSIYLKDECLDELLHFFAKDAFTREFLRSQRFECSVNEKGAKTHTL